MDPEDYVMLSTNDVLIRGSHDWSASSIVGPVLPTAVCPQHHEDLGTAPTDS